MRGSTGASTQALEDNPVTFNTAERDNSAERSLSISVTSMAISQDANKRERFKQLLRKIGSGEHTSKGLSRNEADEAMELMLTGGASDVQIGAFLIAHRIRRPEPQELTGMLDTYRRLGPCLRSEPNQRRPICFGMPFDGRSRTAPIYPLTALLLVAAGQPVVLQGGRRMPVKYGVTASELFSSIGLDLHGMTIQEVQTGFNLHGLALIHQPDHFPIGEALIPARDDLGKRPPLASAELLWTAHQGHHLLVSGFVHPPTESRAWQALEIAGETNVVTVKGLEGGTDLPVSRAGITARVQIPSDPERHIVHPRDHGCFGDDPKWESEETWAAQAKEALLGHGPMAHSLRWNTGCYFWLSGLSESLQDGVDRAKSMQDKGNGNSILERLISWRASVGGLTTASSKPASSSRSNSIECVSNATQ